MNAFLFILTMSIRINDYKITIIINLNVSTNFISMNFVNKKTLFTRSKNDKTLLKKNKMINLKTKLLLIVIQ